MFPTSPSPRCPSDEDQAVNDTALGHYRPAFDTLDRQRFLVVRTLKPAQSSVVVVQNWFDEFARRD